MISSKHYVVHDPKPDSKKEVKSRVDIKGTTKTLIVLDTLGLNNKLQAHAVGIKSREDLRKFQKQFYINWKIKMATHNILANRYLEMGKSRTNED